MVDTQYLPLAFCDIGFTLFSQLDSSSVRLAQQMAQSEFANVMPSASAQQNRRATVVLDELAESASPGASIQKAIDSLPVTGGAVVLPAGRFVLRRHIVLRSGVTLRGQGVDRTVLAVAPITGAKITERDGVNVTVDDASALAVGDAVSLGPMWAHPGQVGVRKAGNLGVLITAIDGNRLTLTEPPSEKVKVLYHFFPAVFARTEEFVEVRDLAIEGDRQTDAKVNGRFMFALRMRFTGCQ